MHLPAAERIRLRCVQIGDCMVFTGAKNRKGYGQINLSWRPRKTGRVHRVWWLAHGREIPEGMQLDHLCRNRACVRLDHLEVVTARENILRGQGQAARNKRKTHCQRGHPFDAENTYIHPTSGRRICRICRRDSKQAWKASSGRLRCRVR